MFEGRNRRNSSRIRSYAIPCQLEAVNDGTAAYRYKAPWKIEQSQKRDPSHRGTMVSCFFCKIGDVVVYLCRGLLILQV